MKYTTEQFLATIKPYVIEDMKKSGILASLTAAQALLESGHGNSGLTQKANNLFGITGTYNGQSIKMETTEYDKSGNPYLRVADFRKYPSWAESIADHSALFNRLKRYANLRNCTDWKQATINVKADGYATSPVYTQSLQNIIQKYKLYEWDNEVLYGNPITGNPYTEPTNNVKFGSKGNYVKWVQYELNKRGNKLSIDGDFGEKTKAAVIAFQNIAFPDDPKEWDGIVGKKTREKLKTMPLNEGE